MVRGKKPPVEQEYLSQSERENLESEKKDLENTLAQAEGFGQGTEGLDVAAIKRDIARLDHAIGERTPQSARGKEKDALIKEEREIEEKLQVGMPTDFEMRQPHRNPGAVKKHQNWLSRNNPLIERYRTIQRILRPFDPKSVESLRKDR